MVWLRSLLDVAVFSPFIVQTRIVRMSKDMSVLSVIEECARLRALKHT
jgi:hypothetical protein